MKRGLFIILLALAAGGATFWVTRSHQQTTRREVLLDAMPELAWLKGELNLNNEQFAQAVALHTGYRPQCVAMCRAISEARAKMEELARTSRGMTPELAAAIADHARVQAECRRKMLEHLYQTAALMDPKQAARYLEKVLPLALNSDHGGTTSCHQD